MLIQQVVTPGRPTPAQPVHPDFAEAFAQSVLNPCSLAPHLICSASRTRPCAGCKLGPSLSPDCLLPLSGALTHLDLSHNELKDLPTSLQVG